MHRRHLIATAAALVPGLSLGQPRTEKITVASWSKPITEVMPLLVDPDKGFYRAQGIELVYASGVGGGDAIRNILSGQADVAFTDPGSLFAALDKGERLRVVYDIYPQNVFNVVSLRKSGIRSPADLRGKKIGVYSLSSGTRQNLQVLLHQAGLRESDVTVVVTGLLNFAPLLQGQVDATAATDTGLATGRHRGLGDLDVIEVAKYLNVSSDLFVVKEDVYRQRKDALRRFLLAYRDAAGWMSAQPAEAVRLASTRATDGTDPELALEVIRLRNAASTSELTRREGPGTMDITSLQKAADVYKQLGLIERAIDMRQVIAGDLLSGTP